MKKTDEKGIESTANRMLSMAKLNTSIQLPGFVVIRKLIFFGSTHTKILRVRESEVCDTGEIAWKKMAWNANDDIKWRQRKVNGRNTRNNHACVAGGRHGVGGDAIMREWREGTWCRRRCNHA